MMGSPSVSIDCRSLPIAAGCLALALLAGCGGKNYQPPAPAEPAAAQAALEKSLDCWRLRITPDELQKADPPINFADEDCYAGRRLIEYRLLAGEELAGSNIRWPVRLRLVQADGSEQIIDVLYIIGTNPGIHIARAD
jgi:hypothetical protein